MKSAGAPMAHYTMYAPPVDLTGQWEPLSNGQAKDSQPSTSRVAILVHKSALFLEERGRA